MLFNSYEFIFVFLPTSFFVYFYLNSKRLTTASKAWLVFTSLFFYSWWNIMYLPLILISVLFNYTITNTMIEYDRSKEKYLSKKSLLQAGLLFNIGLLVHFKYMDFFISNVNSAFRVDIELLHLALPLAISFFTLQQIAFLIDSYEGLVKEKSFLDYTIFVTFFPQLIAGPIVHHKEMMHQFGSIKNKVKNYRNIAMGLFIFSIGLFKKVVIADTFAVWATNGFDVATTLSLFEAWATSLSYTFQLYFDFSGYTDMAIGAALLFNIRLPQNFNSPYKATGMIDFWKRWHMTLTSFITTYIYTPIIKSFDKLTFNKAMLATVVTFLIAGLWHGASWVFVIFGGLHGLGIAINHYWQKKIKIKMNKAVAWFITFNFINITFIFFRANDLDAALNMLKSMFLYTNIILPGFMSEYVSNEFLFKFGGWMHNISTEGGMDVIFSLTLAFTLISLSSVNDLSKKFTLNVKYMLFLITIILCNLFYLSGEEVFLYYEF